MEYFSPVWGGGGSVALGLLEKIQSRARVLIIRPSLTNQLPSLELRRNVASLSLIYRYFYGHCLDELLGIIPLLPLRGRSARGMESAHSLTLTISAGLPQSSKSSFFVFIF